MSDPLHTALIAARAELATTRARLAALEAVERSLVALVAEAPASAVEPKRRGRQAKPTVERKARAGRQLSLDTAALENDVLAALKKLRRPAKASEVCDHVPGVDKTQIVVVLRDLTKRKLVVKSGATISLRYAAPEFAEAA